MAANAGITVGVFSPPQARSEAPAPLAPSMQEQNEAPAPRWHARESPQASLGASDAIKRAVEQNAGIRCARGARPT